MGMAVKGPDKGLEPKFSGSSAEVAFVNGGPGLAANVVAAAKVDAKRIEESCHNCKGIL